MVLQLSNWSQYLIDYDKKHVWNGWIDRRKLRQSQFKKTTGTVLRKFPEHQRKAQTGNRSNAQSSYEETTDSDFIETSKALYGTQSECSTSTFVQRKESMVFTTTPSKKMKIEADGINNKVTITFEWIRIRARDVSCEGLFELFLIKR